MPRYIPGTGSLLQEKVVSSITARDLNEKQVKIDCANTGKPTILYVFAPDCRWCEANLNSIRTIARLRGGSYRFIGLSLSEDGLREYVDRSKFTFPVYKGLSQEAIIMLGLGYTPQTIILSPEGKVLRNWIGAYEDALRPEVERYFGIDLSDVSPRKGEERQERSEGHCVYCTDGGVIYSPGAVIRKTTGDKHCRDDGRWTQL